MEKFDLIIQDAKTNRVLLSIDRLDIKSIKDKNGVFVIKLDHGKHLKKMQDPVKRHKIKMKAGVSSKG